MDKSAEKRVQQVEISYNYVGVLELPDSNKTNSGVAKTDYTACCDNTSLLRRPLFHRPVQSLRTESLCSR